MKLEFTVREYCGHEVYLNIHKRHRILILDRLTVGSVVYAPSPFLRDAWYSLTVVERGKKDGELYAQTSPEGIGATLEFAKDDRCCWVASCFMNLAGIKRITIT